MDIERLLLVYFQKAKIPFDLMLSKGYLGRGRRAVCSLKLKFAY
jgi:hypothetical protein